MRVVVRALSVLTLLSVHPRGLTLQELHERLEVPLASMHRILATLVAEEFVFRSPVNRRYFLGARATGLSQPQNYDSFVTPPPTALTDAANDSGETMFLTQLIDQNIVCVSLIEARHNLRLSVGIGQSVPLDTAASARIVLAHLEPDVRDAVLQADALNLGLTQPGPQRTNLLDHLELVRSRGFDFCAGELDEGVWAVSAPVFDAAGSVVLGVTLAAAATRVEDIERKVESLVTVLRAADTLSHENGYVVTARPQPHPDDFLRAFDPMRRAEAHGDHKSERTTAPKR